MSLVEQHEQDVLHALKTDLGKPAAEAFFEIAALRQELKLTKRNLHRWMRSQRIPVPITLSPGQAQVVPEPLGCVLVIGPWNYPFQLMLRPLISALAAGNTAVLKPSEHAPTVSALIARLVENHFEPEVVRVQQGDGTVAAQLVAMPFDHIFFTGGENIGRKVLAGAAKNLTPVTLELGGKSPALVLQGANLSVSARRLIWGKGINAGQTCIAPDHILVEPSLRSGLLDAMHNQRSRMYGENVLASDQLGKIINQQQFDRLEKLLEQAREDGRILIGGEISREQNRIAPTVIDVKDRQDPLMGEELFGPLLPIIQIGSLSDSLREIRRQGKPLALYVFGGSKAQQKEILGTTSSGGVCLNDVIMQAAIPELPFGGVGTSGMGSYHGQNGFRTFSHYKAVLKRGFRFDFKLRYPPYNIGLKTLRQMVG
ncbi:aldehyde dehydrogenase family protein [Synechococcus sp. M16CYN]